MKSEVKCSPLLRPNALALFFLIINATIFSSNIAGQDFTTVYWTAAANQPYNVFEGQGEAVNGKLYTFGGFDSEKLALYGQWTPTSRAYVYDPQNNSWKSIAPMPPMNGTSYGGVTHAGFATDNVNIFFAGGYTSNSTGTGQIFGTKEVWKYIVAENRYIRLPNLPKLLGSGQMEFLNNKLHHIGGFPGNPNSTVEVADHYVLDLNNTIAGWKTLAPIPIPRNHMGSATYGGKIYIIGGQNGNDHTSVTRKDVFMYNPATNSWSQVANMPVPTGTNGRAHISSAVFVAGNRIIVVGGETSHAVRTNMVSAYSPATNTWQNLTPYPRTVAGGVGAVLLNNFYFTGGPNSKATFKGAPATTTTLTPIADAFVRNGTYAALNFGKDTALMVKGSPSAGYTRFSFLKFSLGTLQNVATAKLRIYGRNVENTSTISVSAYGVNNDGWSETAVTFNNQPAPSTSVLGTTLVNNTAKYSEVDVTGYTRSQVTGDKTVTLMLKDATNQNRHLIFNSREKPSNKPQLVVVSTITVNLAVQQQVTLQNEEQPVRGEKVIYPNPVRSTIHLKLLPGSSRITTAIITDALGRNYLVDKSSITQNNTGITVQIDGLALKPGVYFIRLNATDNETFRFVVE